MIVRLDAVGDALTAVPLIAALRAHGVRVGAVLRPGNAHAYSAHACDRVHVAEPQCERLAGELARERYDVALIATEKAEAYRLAARARIPQRVGFENGWGKPLKTLWIRRLCTKTVFRTAGLDPHAPHECEVVFSLGRALLGDAEPSRDPAVLRPYVIDDPPARGSYIAMQITDKWARLGARIEQVTEIAGLACRFGRTRFLCAASEASYGNRFAEKTGEPIEFFDDLRPWKTAIASARAVLSPDSGAAHVAGMTGTPVAVCFASEQFALQCARWSPWAAPYRAVRMEGPWPAIAADALGELLTDRPPISYTG